MTICRDPPVLPSHSHSPWWQGNPRRCAILAHLLDKQFIAALAGCPEVNCAEIAGLACGRERRSALLFVARIAVLPKSRPHSGVGNFCLFGHSPANAVNRGGR